MRVRIHFTPRVTGLACAAALVGAIPSCGGDDAEEPVASSTSADATDESGGAVTSATSGETTASGDEEDSGSDTGGLTVTGGSTDGAGGTVGTGGMTSWDSAGAETGESCPYAPSEINCSIVCQARRDYCEACVDGPCNAFDVYRDLSDCISICNSVYASPDVDSLQLEADGCFMLTGGSCEWSECFLGASC